MTATWGDLANLNERWKAQFGAHFPMGYPVYPSAAPLIRRCLEAKDSSEFDAWLDMKVNMMISNDEIW